MSQHDYDIANQTAPNTRADMNLALKALASTSSGTSAPTTTFANQLYYNTTDNVLYKRNEADSAWIAIGTVDEGTGKFTQSGERSLSSQAQAEAGSDDTTVMTPLKTSQAIAALATASDIVGSQVYSTLTGTTVLKSCVPQGAVAPAFSSSVASSAKNCFQTTLVTALTDCVINILVSSTHVANSTSKLHVYIDGVAVQTWTSSQTNSTYTATLSAGSQLFLAAEVSGGGGNTSSLTLTKCDYRVDTRAGVIL